MPEKQLLNGNYAIVQAAIQAGLQSYFGYPITPQSEIGEYLSEELPALGRAFVCAESEVAAINMLLGAGATGVKAMTSSSACAIALMQEGLSFIALDEVPCVLISVMRAGPGLGYIYPAQGDYNQAVKGGGNGDYKIITFAPSCVQECIDLTYKAFYVSQKYRTPVCVLSDGLIGQMMEPALLGGYPYPEVETDSWALSGAKGRKPRCIKTIEREPEVLQDRVTKLFEKYALIAKNENTYEKYKLDDAELVVTAFGSIARVAKSAVKKARQQGMKVGLFRPIMLNPFPEKEIGEMAKKAKMILDIELNMGQMLQDVKASVNTDVPIEFYGRAAGKMMTVDEIYAQIYNKYMKMNEGSYGKTCVSKA